jgi:uncharacterized protein YraI
MIPLHYIHLFARSSSHDTALNPLPNRQTERRTRRRSSLSALMVWVPMLLLVAIGLVACGPSRPATDSNSLPAQARQIALDYQASGDLQVAKATLAALSVANPNQWLLLVAETAISQEDGAEATNALVLLTWDLGLRSTLVERYAQRNNLIASAPEVAPTATPTPAAAIVAVQPPRQETNREPSTENAAEEAADAEVEAETNSTESNTGASAESAPTPTNAPAVDTSARVQAAAPMNVRAGPGTDHPIIAALQTNNSASITGKNAAGDWWQIQLTNGSSGWIYAPLVQATGNVAAVSVAQVIPTAPPATATPLPQPTPVPAAQQPAQEQPAQEQPAQEQPPQAEPPSAPVAAPPPPPSGMEFSMVSTRLRPVGQDAQSCGGGENSIFVFVQDAGGAPINGVRVKEVYTGQVKESGLKGPGMAQWDIYRGGGGVVQLVDGGGNPISPPSAGMSADWPAFQMMWDAGYCNCKPHPDADSCRHDLENKQFLFAVGHYTYEVIFRRNH